MSSPNDVDISGAYAERIVEISAAYQTIGKAERERSDKVRVLMMKPSSQWGGNMPLVLTCNTILRKKTM